MGCIICLTITLFHFNRKRKPAFTDRILYRNTLSDRVAKADQERVALRVLHYESIRQYCGSDHKPVRAIAHISASAFAEKIKWLQSRVKQRLSKRDSPGLRAKTHRAPAVQGPAHGEGRSTDGVVADSPSSRSAPRSRHYYHEDPSLSLARQMTVQFEPIRDWTVESNHTIFFRVMDNRTNQTVGPDFPGLFQVLSNWDWIGKLVEAFRVCFTYAVLPCIDRFVPRGFLLAGQLCHLCLPSIWRDS